MVVYILDEGMAWMQSICTALQLLEVSILIDYKYGGCRVSSIILRNRSKRQRKLQLKTPNLPAAPKRAPHCGKGIP